MRICQNSWLQMTEIISDTFKLKLEYVGSQKGDRRAGLRPETNQNSLCIFYLAFYSLPVERFSSLFRLTEWRA